MLKFLDLALYTIHVVVILSNTFLWIWKRTRKVHLVIILMTAFSWFVMGIWYGWGYCFLTDWEWDIKRQLGETDLPPSFIHYWVNNSMGLDISPAVLDALTLGVFILALVMSLLLNGRAYLRSPKNR
jgi:hypothetical protein